jgi:ADP-dependent NAD(P)H-hydrate dehydratase / NAD(P)H-hydrate epimerase
VIDALFGTGLKEPLGGLPLKIVKALNESPNTVVSVDVPSGLSGDTHQLIGDAIKATLTVTLGAPKLPLVLPPGEAHCGELAVVDIGIPQKLIDELEGPRVELLSAADLIPHLAPRDQESNKGDFGRIVIVAGSPGKTGAGYLASMAALRSGAGLVTVATPRASQPILAAMAPEYMTEALDDEPGGGLGEASLERVLALKKDVIAVGPGLGNGPWQQAFVFGLLERSDVTLVLDADALNVCADDPHRLRAREGIDIIITPHPGEMARLTGLSIDEVQENRLEVARNFAMSHGVHVVLKGHRTLIAAPDGHVSINPTGNPGMATGGTGDVLTGVIAAWFGQLLDAEAACKVGVYLHGFAGDLAQHEIGETALIASDIIAHLGQATREIFTSPLDDLDVDDEDD